MNLLLALLCCNTCGLLKDKLNENSPSPRIIIVGAGAAGIAAASRLLENGFTDITILEAENRIGGRVWSIKIGDYLADMGGQWVHGEKNNVAFELAWPLGLIERFDENHNFSVRFFGSSGSALSLKTSLNLVELHNSMTNDLADVENLPESFGQFADMKMDKFFKAHKEISPDLYDSLRYMTNLGQMASDGADNWYEVSAKGLRDYAICDGDNSINWKNRTYSTILDILMKKYPNPDEELPVLENVYKDSRVIKINYNKGYNTVKVSTADGEEYLGDHVIFTPSLGVLKANYQRLFSPPLPEKKVEAIKNLGFGHEAKILLYYENPWWYTDENKYNSKGIYWTKADREEIENDPERKWMLGLFALYPVEHKPKMLCFWVSSDFSIEMELVPEEIFRQQILQVINKFFSNHYNITEPTKIIRTSWNTNENFLGTYSYRGIESDLADVDYTDLAEPIMRNNKPFAGEATSEHYSTVHGAIDSGWREADRLINLYPRKNDLLKLLTRLTEKKK
ncbi:hypothetical protein PV326_008379 [Microctonus aethiopoides]|nr:hypothetical protein PV326_008379 [Microctonus aethiopoides]